MKKSNKKENSKRVAPEMNETFTFINPLHDWISNSQPGMSHGYQSQEKRADMANRIQKASADADEPTPVSREELLRIMRHTSTQSFVSDMLDGRYLLNVPTVKFRYDDFMRIVEDIDKIKDSQLREDIVMKICESQF